MSLEILRPVFLCVLLAGTILPLVSCVVERFLMKKASASTKHRLWTLTAVGLLCFPVIVLLMRNEKQEPVTETATVETDIVESKIPLVLAENGESPILQSWAASQEPVAPIAGVAVDTGVPAKWEVPMESEAASNEFPFHYILNTATALWLTGFAWTGLYFLVVHLKSTLFLLRIQKGRQSDSPLARQVRLWFSGETSIPLAFGIFRPTVVFPSEAKDWPKDKFDAVLLHELAHIARRDLLWQNVVCAACVLYWFHPFVWFVSRRIRTEQELACDDMVLQSGKRSSDYASVLLELSKNLSAEQPVPEGGLAMLRKKTVVQRIDSILDEKTSRKPISRKATLGILFGVLLLSFGVSFFAPKITLPSFVQADELAVSEVVESVAPETEKKQPGIKLCFVDPDGKPVPKGYVRTHVIASQDDWKGGSKRIDFENGGLFIPFPEGKPLTDFIFHCYADGFTPYYAKWDNVKNEAVPTEFTVTLEHAEMIGGIVADESGQPVEGVDVEVSIEWGKHQRIVTQGFHCSLPCKTDAEGRWRCTMLPKENIGDRAGITLKHPDYSNTRVQRGLLKEFQPNAEGELSFRLTIEKGITVTGKVINIDGKPVVGAHVFSNIVKNSFPAKENNTKTDENGEFRFERCLSNVSQSYLGVVVVDFAPEIVSPIDLSPNTPPITLTLKPGRSVTFRAIDKEGKGIAGTRIVVAKMNAIRSFGEFFELPVNGGKTDENGELVWKNAPPDEFDVSVGKSGFMSSSSDRTIGKEQNEYVFTLRRPVKIACTAIDAETGKPIPEFRLDSGSTSKKDPRIKNPDQKVFWHG